MSTQLQPAADADIWADGALTTAQAMVFLCTSNTGIFLLAKAQGWPRRYRGLGTLWPKRVLMDYLANLPTVRGKQKAGA